MAEYWLDPSGNIRRMEGEQEIIAKVMDDCSEHELTAILNMLNTLFADYDGLKLGTVARISSALMRSMLRDQAKDWVSTPNPALQGRSPEDAVADGDGEIVLFLVQKSNTDPS